MSLFQEEAGADIVVSICQASHMPGFGTSASPCEQPIIPSHLEEELLSSLRSFYYAGNQFIALDLDSKWSVYEAPFAFWCLADDSEESRSFLRSFIEEKGESLRTVLYDQEEKAFFYYFRGQKEILQA